MKDVEEYKRKLSTISFEELKEECINLWIELQQERDYQQTLIQEGKKYLDIEREEKEYYKNRLLEVMER